MISKLSSSDLIQKLKVLVQTERKITSQILDLLEEVENRKAYLELGYENLLVFCLKELKYSESAAYRRIQAMRARRQNPQIKTSLLDGSLSLSVVAKTASFIWAEEKKSHEKLSYDERKSLFSQLQNKTMRECEKILIEKYPNSIRIQESVRPINAETTELKIMFNSEDLEKLNLIQSFISHKIPDINYTEVIRWMSDEVLTRLNPAANRNGRSKSKKIEPPSGQRIYLSKELKRLVWKKSQGQCCFKNPNSGKRCDSRFWLEIDHIVPLSLGGTNKIENLQLLCRAHNQWKGARYSPSSFIN